MILILNNDWINNYMNELITIWKKIDAEKF